MEKLKKFFKLNIKSIYILLIFIFASLLSNWEKSLSIIKDTFNQNHPPLWISTTMIFLFIFSMIICCYFKAKCSQKINISIINELAVTNSIFVSLYVFANHNFYILTWTNLIALFSLSIISGVLIGISSSLNKDSLMQLISGMLYFFILFLINNNIAKNNHDYYISYLLDCAFIYFGALLLLLKKKIKLHKSSF